MKTAWGSGMLRVRAEGKAEARGMAEIAAVMAHWQLDMRHVRERM